MCHIFVDINVTATILADWVRQIKSMTNFCKLVVNGAFHCRVFFNVSNKSTGCWAHSDDFSQMSVTKIISLCVCVWIKNGDGELAFVPDLLHVKKLISDHM